LHKTTLRYLLFGFIAASAFGAGVWVNTTRQAAAPVASGGEAIWALKLPDLQNRVQHLDQWRGKVLVVNFWATWCAPCREEIPVFVKMQQKYAHRGLQFVGISIDQADKTLEFATNFAINYPNLIGTFDTIEVSRQAGNQKRVLPYTLILGRNGQIAATQSGSLNEQKMESLIQSLL
jgi:thiol-disulfide isomerase/thioredoxin